MIAQKLAVGLIEPFAAAPWCKNGVVVKPFEPRIEYPYVVATPENQPVSRMAREFIKILRIDLHAWSCNKRRVSWDFSPIHPYDRSSFIACVVE